MTPNNKNNKQPSRELTNLLVNLKRSISDLKEIYLTIDKKALEEGFSIEEIYDIANVTDITTITNYKNNNIFYPHFQ
jgi:hypothetical protein